MPADIRSGFDAVMNILQKRGVTRKVVAEWLGCNPSYISTMRRQGVERKYAVRFYLIAKENGHEFDLLKIMSTPEEQKKIIEGWRQRQRVR